jgi:hypothetical protein
LEETTNYASFLVRLWRKEEPELAEATGDWQGEVEHIQSGQRWSFDMLEELLSVLRRQAEGPSPVDEGDQVSITS